MGEFIVACSFINVVDRFIWAFVVSMDLILIGIEDFYGMSWLVCLVGAPVMVHWGRF